MSQRLSWLNFKAILTLKKKKLEDKTKQWKQKITLCNDTKAELSEYKETITRVVSEAIKNSDDHEAFANALSKETTPLKKLDFQYVASWYIKRARHKLLP